MKVFLEFVQQLCCSLPQLQWLSLHSVHARDLHDELRPLLEVIRITLLNKLTVLRYPVRGHPNYLLLWQPAYRHGLAC